MGILLIAALAFVGRRPARRRRVPAAAPEAGQQDRGPPRPVDRRGRVLGGQGRLSKEASILTQPLDDRPSLLQQFAERFGNIELLFDQADTNLTVTKLLAISGVMARGRHRVGCRVAGPSGAACR